MTAAATVAAAVLAGTAVALLLRGPAWTPVPRVGGRFWPALVPVAVGVPLALLWSLMSPRAFVLAVLLAAVALAIGRLVRRRQAARSAEQRSDRVLAVCEALASDLAAGQPPLLSLERAATEWPEFAPVAAAGRMGAGVPAVLRELALSPGARQLRILAATWQVAHDTGAGLAGAIAKAAGSIREDRRTARLVAAELAAAHATARMLAVLPLGVLLLGSGIGGDPIGFLVDTTAGLVCLALGLGLSFAGLSWLDRITDRVLRR